MHRVIWLQTLSGLQAFAAAPAAARGGAAKAWSAEAPYVPASRKVSLAEAVSESTV